MAGTVFDSSVLIDALSGRRRLKRSGITATIPDAHIAQCALDRDAVLLTRDAIFRRMARHIPLRVLAG